jgi:hypothetical protein
VTNPSKPAGGDANWQKLPVAWPLVACIFALGSWANLEFGSVMSSISSGVGFLAAFAVVKFIFPLVKTSFIASFLKALESRRLARTLWIVLVVAMLATLTVGSVKVNSDKLPHTVDIYRVQLESNGAGAGTQSGRHLLNSAKAQQSFYIGLPFRKRIYLATSNNEMSREMTVYPWIVPSISYPGDFKPLSQLAILPAPRMRLEFGVGRWLRLVVAREGAHPKILAEDTLRAFQSRVVAFDTSTVSDETARTSWLPLARDSLSIEAADAELVVTDWLHRQLLRSVDPLLPGQQLRVTLLNQKKDTLRTAVVTLSPGLSNVLLRY